MIVFDLQCDGGHRFEGWFGSSSDYKDQSERGLVTCPECGSDHVGKAIMAPAVGAKGNTRSDASSPSEPNRRISVPGPNAAGGDAKPASTPVSNTPLPAEVQKALKVLAKAQQEALKSSTWVGKDFAAQSRAMHYGESDEKPIHGQASLEEAQSLAEEGVNVAALPFPVAPPDKLN